MKFKGYYFMLMIFALAMLPGCGGGGDGHGATVYIQASIEDGAPAAIATTATTVNNTSFTVKSTAYNSSGTVVNSNVQLNRISYSFTPAVGSGLPAFTPTVQYISWPGGLLEPGGTENVENVFVLWPVDLPAFVTACGASHSSYDAKVTISGEEVNTGIDLSASTTITVFCP
jgi:hypothetical protein